MRRAGLLGMASGLMAVLVAGMMMPMAMGQWNPPNPVVSFAQTADGVKVEQRDGVLRIEVKAADVLHVTYAPPGPPAPERPWDGVVVKKDWPGAAFEVNSNDKMITLTTAKLTVAIERESGAIHYVAPDPQVAGGGVVATGPGSVGRRMAGKMLATDGYRSLRPVEVNGEKTFHAEVSFGNYGSHEGLYGLGQHQAGVWNYRGETVDLSQENTNIAIPLLVSTNGYGIFWNNPSRSRMNNRFVHALYLSAEVADRIDYYFIYGPETDSIIGHYRELTGEVPLFGRVGVWVLAVQEQVRVAGGD